MSGLFVFLDTNILIRVATQGQPGCEEHCWEELRKLANDSKVTILVPDIVRLEFSRHARSSIDDLRKGTAKFQEKVRALQKDEEADPFWNESRSLVTTFKETINSSWDELLKDTVAKWRERFANLDSWLHSPGVTAIPFDERILLRAKRRLIAGRYPKQDSSKWTQQQRADRLLDGDCDFCIIESLAWFFERSSGDNTLLFCTENVAHFGLETKDGGRFIHPLLRDGLPPSEIFTDLSSLLEFIKTNRSIDEPEQQAVEEALKKTQADEERIAREMSWQPISSSMTTSTTTTPPPSSSGATLLQWKCVAGVWTRVLGFPRPIAKRVNVLVPNVFEQLEQVGTICFYCLPVRNPDEYGWSGVIPDKFEEVRDISQSLLQNQVRGSIGGYEWWAD
jgi:predicted nucleic acid-binding protein